MSAQLQPVDVSNFYSLVNGIIMALAGFNYLALCYEKHVIAKWVRCAVFTLSAPKKEEHSHQRFYVASINDSSDG